MSRSKQPQPANITGRRIRALREELVWSQETLGVAIGIDESSARARISRYELGVHEPPLPTVRLIADALNVPLSYLYCEDDRIALLLLAIHRLNPEQRAQRVDQFLDLLTPPTADTL
ncbi:helix-turn-helix domain-containing protein [Dechloromonas denitrificans]|uniref:helix-turn-helix domain-containing protein n=1 Tax=Dechloromonas denitrificans TaxID=281362 RepID=UPI001CFA2BD3|nr:helix-turn-helix transcriptional regulator [Dechloromonas denitrificans]UCV07202.1 helix-turn-helix transcriptional regulator [Dechloromonas denitrificans]